MDCNSAIEEARLLQAAHNFTAAASRLETTRRLCEIRPEMLDLLARAYLGAQEFEKGLDVATALVALTPRSPDALVLKGNLEYLLAKDDDAEKSFQQAIEIAPNSEEPRYALGRLYAQKQRHSLALAQFETIVKDHPNSYRAWDNLGLAQEALGKPDAAIQSYLRAIALVAKDHPEYDWPYTNLANLLISRNESRRAFDLAVTAAERNPSSARAYYMAAKALTRLDQSEKSIRWLRRSAELDPGYPEPHYLLGQVLRKFGQTAESEKEFAEFKKLRDVQPSRRR